jgi:hypothetical protein
MGDTAELSSSYKQNMVISIPFSLKAPHFCLHLLKVEVAPENFKSPQWRLA